MKKTTLAAIALGTISVFSLGVGSAFAATYTTTQIAPHNVATDCWEIISNKVYNLTSFIALHTGGEAVIIAQCGKDATVTFANGPHSASSIAALSPYLLGDFTTVVTPPVVVPPVVTPAATATPTVVSTTTPSVTKIHRESQKRSTHVGRHQKSRRSGMLSQLNAAAHSEAEGNEGTDK